MTRSLIIDDSLVIRSLLSDFLIDEGYDVTAVDDPVEGIQIAKDEDWSLCICDTHMPSKSGYQVLTEVRAVKAELPFLITDSLPEDLAIERPPKETTYYYLRKPFELDQLREILTNLFQTVKS